MEKFKVGDTVRRIDHPNTGSGMRLEVGTEAKVVSLSGHWLMLEGYEKLGASNTDYFELVKPVNTLAQEFAIAAGIQQHSIGGTYPLAAVMYEYNGEKCITIEDLQTGEVAAIENRVTDWHTFENAYRTIELIAKGANWFKTKGRVMNMGGSWVVAEPANPVRVTRLHSMLHRGQDTNSSGS